jgi:Zn-finger nucleic acid-binding protein
MPVSAPFGLRCPDCNSILRGDRTKMNVDLDVCPNDHGVLLDRSDVEAMVGPQATQAIQNLAEESRDTRGPCPNCAAPFRDIVVNEVAARGCGVCGNLWFATNDLKAHVLGVRRRAYGERSMAARADVMMDATAFMAAETVAGILTDYQLEQNL